MTPKLVKKKNDIKLGAVTETDKRNTTTLRNYVTVIFRIYDKFGETMKNLLQKVLSTNKTQNFIFRGIMYQINS